ncbi:MAG: hypothetical protein RLZZ422_1097 [Pseudomonadota bacterium]|jgi:hypothetical protein
MPELKRITEGGYYPYIDLYGDSSVNDCDGLVIDAPDQVVMIGRANVLNTRVPLIALRCQRLIIEEYHAFGIWGDAHNFRTSNIDIDRYLVHGFQKRFTYEQWHMDTGGQAYAVKANGWEIDTDGVIENIAIRSFESYADIPDANCVMLSELCQYRNINIGTQRLSIITGGDYWLNANNLSDSVLGGGDVSIIGLRNQSPTLLIKNRPKNGIQGCHASGNIHLINIPFLDKSSIDCEVASYGDFELEQAA